jgi:hypothetical protein
MRGEGAAPRGERRPRPAPSFSVQLREYDSLPPLTPEAERLYNFMTRAPRRAAVAFALAGLAHALVATAVLFILTGQEFDPQTVLVTFFAQAWPVVPTVVVVALADRRMQIVWPAVFVAAVLLVGGPYRVAIGLIWLAYMLAPTAAMFAVGNWWMRSIGPVLLVFASVFLFGLVSSPYAGANLVNGLLGSENVGLILLTTGLYVVLFAGAAWLFIWRVGRRYGARRTSDQLIVLNLYWLLVTEWQCLLVSPKVGVLAASAGMLAYVAYRLVLAAALTPMRWAADDRRKAGADVKLLLLRVFGSPARSERALEEVGLRWRYAGSIQLIAGEDLALANLEPDELVNFLTLRLGSHFIKSRGQLERKISDVYKEGLGPDPDGRFRVNEFFCGGAIWREALVRLVGENDVVLMDLRGFGEGNEGVAYELTQLINIKPMCKTVMMIDKDTKKDILERVLTEAWLEIRPDSPNPRWPREPLPLLRVGRQNSREARRLVRLLCAAALADA